jgi:SAM-dependent methyltransferase
LVEWFDDDGLWRLVRDAVFPPASFAAAPGEIAALFELLGIGRGRSLDVLDLPCGPGRHALPLAQAGHRVVAVDRTRAYLEELEQRLADRRARQPGRDLEIETVAADMREFRRPGAFDLALNLYTSLGYFEDIEDDRRTLRGLRESLRPGGVLAIDLVGREVLARIFEARRWTRLDDGTIQLAENRVTDAWRWMEVSWTFVRDGVSRTVDLSHRIWGANDLERELLAAGFSRVAFHGAFDGRPYDHEATRLVAIATA